MKNTIKILGFIALLAIIGFSLGSCGDSGGTGTVVCNNVSTWAADAYVTMYLLQNGNTINTISSVPRNYSGEWRNVPTGSNYAVNVKDSNGLTIKYVGTFKVEKNKTKILNYNGTSVQ